MDNQMYTLTQAAAALGVNEDNLRVLLPSVKINLTERNPATLTQPELDQLSGLVRDIHTIHREGPFDGIDE